MHEKTISSYVSQTSKTITLIIPNNTIVYCETIMKPKIGKFRVPKIRLKILLGELNKLYKTYRETPFTTIEFGNALNISPISSGLEQKKYELKNLGLLKGDTELTITDSGVKALQSNPIERQKEIENIVKRIGLWNELLNLGKNIEDPLFLITLQNKTGLNEEIIKERFKEIKWAFNEDVNCITQFDPNIVNTTKPRKLKPHHSPMISQLQTTNEDTNTGYGTYRKILHNNNKNKLSVPIKWKVTSDFGEFQTEVLDELSLSNAKLITMQLLDTIEMKITNNRNSKK